MQPQQLYSSVSGVPLGNHRFRGGFETTLSGFFLTADGAVTGLPLSSGVGSGCDCSLHDLYCSAIPSDASSFVGIVAGDRLRMPMGSHVTLADEPMVDQWAVIRPSTVLFLTEQAEHECAMPSLVFTNPEAFQGLFRLAVLAGKSARGRTVTSANAR